jgi:hypothetical protein
MDNVQKTNNGMKIMSRYLMSGQDSNQAPPEYKSEVMWLENNLFCVSYINSWIQWVQSV